MTDTVAYEDTALRYTKTFERKYGEEILHLAFHAALPVAINADLIHLLRINFFLDSPQPLPYTAEADLLLSSLCHNIGDGLYEIAPNIRDVLLQRLVREYSHERIHDVAMLLWQYNERYGPWADRPELERAQQLTALNFLDPLKAKQWLAEAEVFLGLAPSVEREWFVAMRKEIERIEDRLAFSHPTEQIVKSLGAKLREARLAKKYTQSRLAQPDFSVSYISAIERGQIHPSLRALEILALRLGLSFKDLLPETSLSTSQLNLLEENQADTSKEYNFGELLRLFRKRIGLTQQALADNLGLHYSTISTWERGESLPRSGERALELAKALGLSEEETSTLLHASLFPPETQDAYIRLEDGLEKSQKRLSGAQYEQLVNALLDAYTEQNLAQMLSLKLNKRLSSIASGNTLADIIFNLVRTAEAEGWLEQLISAAYEFNPENQALRELYQRYILGQNAEQRTHTQTSKTTRTKVFISYSHKDKIYLDRLRVHLMGYLHAENEDTLDIRVDVWDDTMFHIGADWNEEIMKALAHTKVAILLVSADYLGSDFIRRYELPMLLEAAQAGEIQILSVILGPTAWEYTPLSRYQTMNPAFEPLMGMKPYDQEVVWAKLTQQIITILNSQK